MRRGGAVRLRIRPRHAGARRRRPARRWRGARAGGRSRCWSTRRYRLLDYRGLTDVHAERVGGRAGARRPHRRRSRTRSNEAGRLLLRRTGMQARAHHAGQPRHGAVPAAAADGAHPDLRVRRSRRCHRRGRHGHRDVRPRARRRRVVLRSGAAGQLRRRARRDEARHGDGVAAGNGRRGHERSRHVAEPWSQEGRHRDGGTRNQGSASDVVADRGRTGRAPSRADRARRGARSRSRTAASICCTSATSATCRARRPKPIG